MFDVQTFYGFSTNPFGSDPNPKFFFTSESHREALAYLLYGISYKKGFILLLADAGLGKTMLLRRLSDTIDKRFRIIYLPDVHMPFLHMLKEILAHLNLQPEHETKGAMVHSLYSELIERQGRQETVVLILDGAENIRLELLEEVRLLANLETGSSKLLQIILAGRPELGKKLQSDSVRQIQQRIGIRSRLEPLTKEESRQYIEHRLKLAGSDFDAVFTNKALKLICKAARGVPLKLNRLCANALLMGCRLSEKRISAATVRMIRREKDFLSEDAAKALAARTGKRRAIRIIIILTLAAILGAAAYWGITHRQTLAPSWKASSSAPPAPAEQQAASAAITPPVPAPPASVPVALQPAKPETIPPPAPPSPQVADTALKKPPEPVLPPAVKNSPPPVQIRKIVEVPQGSNLSLVTLQSYRMVNETLMDHILKLNPEITNPDVLTPRQKIKIPELTKSLLLIGNPSDGYNVHLRTFDNKQTAELYRRVAASWAKNTEIVALKLSAGHTWYRVTAGHFTGADEALKAVEAMMEKGFSIIPANNEL